MSRSGGNENFYLDSPPKTKQSQTLLLVDRKIAYNKATDECFHSISGFLSIETIIMSMEEKYWFADDLKLEISAGRSSRSGSTYSLNSFDDDDLHFSSSPSGIAPLDLTTIKHIYEKALLITKLEEEAQHVNGGQERMLDKIDDGQLQSDSKKKITTLIGKSDRRRNFARFQVDGMSSNAKGWEKENEASGPLHESPSDSSAWSPSEIHILRQCYERTREENSRLRFLLNVRDEELNLIREKYKSQEQNLQHAVAELKMNEKTVQHSEETNKHLKSHCSLLNEEIKNMKEDVKYCQEGRDRLGKEVLRLEKDFNLEREARAKLENNLHQMIQEKQKDILRLEENWKSLHNTEVGRLNRKIAELNQKLIKEEEMRKCIQQGLNSLQRHVPRTPSLGDTRLQNGIMIFSPHP